MTAPLKVGCWVSGSFNSLQMRYQWYIKSMISRCKRINTVVVSASYFNIL